MIREVAHEIENRAIFATHSEVFLNEAADEGHAIAFVGQPRLIGTRLREHAARALREIGLEHCMQAKQTGWVLYPNAPADLSALPRLARRLIHGGATKALQWSFVHYVADSIAAVERHVKALAAVVPGIRGCALLDGPSPDTRDDSGLSGVTALR